MVKKANAIAIADAAKSASLAARAFNRLEREAKRVDAEANADRGLKLISSAGHVRACIKTGNMTIQVEDGVFAVDIGG